MWYDTDEQCQLMPVAALAAADPPTARQARLRAGQGVAAAAGAGRGDGQERGLRAAGQRRDARGLRLARQGDRRKRRRGDRLRGDLGRGAVATASCRRCSMRRATRTTRASPARRASWRRASPAMRPMTRWPRSRRQAARLRKQLDAVVAIDFFGAEGRATGGGTGVRASRRHCKQEDEAMSDGKTRRRPPPGPLEGSRLGDAPGRAGRSHRLGLADPPLHRSRRALQVRARHRLRAAAGRAALRHVRRRVHPSTATAAPSRCCWPCRPRRSGAARDRRDHPRHRPQGRQVRPRGGGGRAQPDRRHRRGAAPTTSSGWRAARRCSTTSTARSRASKASK